MILFEPKMGLNELKWSFMSSNFNKILLAMYISVRYDICYNFYSGLKNAENKERKHLSDLIP